jgi:hypothetical protein
MRLLITIAALLTVAVLSVAPGASAQGVSPAQLTQAGWDCVNPAAAFPANPNVHCFAPGQLAGVVAGTAASAHVITFATPDVNATQAPMLGTERMIRADLFHNQPCPTDPPGYPGVTTSPPLYEWSYLGPRFGWNYYICHTFDSPW